MNGGFLLILLAMFVFMYLLLVRPQRQQQRRHASMLETLKVGDEVITAGGIYGDVTGVESDRVTLEIAEDVEIEVAKRAIASVVPAEELEDFPASEEPDAVADGEVVAEREALEEPSDDALPREDSARR